MYIIRTENRYLFFRFDLTKLFVLITSIPSEFFLAMIRNIIYLKIININDFNNSSSIN